MPGNHPIFFEVAEFFVKVHFKDMFEMPDVNEKQLFLADELACKASDKQLFIPTV
jgi:hypothetical protein